MQYANRSLLQSARSSRWVGFTASVDLSVGLLTSKTSLELQGPSVESTHSSAPKFDTFLQRVLCRSSRYSVSVWA